MTQLTDEGYTVLRMAGSHGACDIIAIKKRNPHDSEIRFIQLKRTKQSPDKITVNSYLRDRDKLKKLEFDTGLFMWEKNGLALTKELWVWVDKVGWITFDVDTD